MLRRLLVVVAVASCVAGAGPVAAFASAADCPPGVAGTTGTNPAPAGIASLIESAASAYDVPPAVLKAVAYRESAWTQYDSNGNVVISSDSVCGIGIMQVTSTEDPDPARLASDIAYNVSAGARILAAKWTAALASPPNGYPPDDRHVTENWFYAVCLYNGCGTDPAYPDRVAEIAADPFRRVPSGLKAFMPAGGFTKPTEADPGYHFPDAFQATPDGHFVFYDSSTGVVSKTVAAPTHDFRVAMPAVVYGAATYGPDGPYVSCIVCGGWRLAEGAGVAGRAHWTSSVTTGESTRVTWLPPLPRQGPYRVSAYVPALGAATLGHATYHVAGVAVPVDQDAVKGSWSALGDRSLTPGQSVYLTDASDVAGQRVVADAVRFSMVTATRLLGVCYLDADGNVTSNCGPPTYGQSRDFSISLRHGGTGLAGRPVRVYKRAVGTAAWTLAGQWTTRADGSLLLTVRPAVSTEYQARYVPANGDATASESAVYRMDVRPAVDASLARATVPRGSTATVSVTVRPPHAGQQVLLQRFYSGFGWRNVLSRPLSSGRAAYTFALPAGSYRFRVLKPADADHAAAYSGVVTLRVT
jgi:hypothetical protein